ncbi:hypothetical protein Pan241w_47650 [Gimesia alba]|uniref:Uncharacterized protein n=2 Tax=Gimesia alba TaxID=2527973 RepID=A0A517RL87_9PLAN|nr:hypothetical protein Pan241w_47650 [Gimesia alba]
MHHFGNLDPELIYILDLVQYSLGRRIIHIRLADEPSHENTVLQSNPYKGAILGEFGSSLQVSPDVKTSDGQQFGIDPHNIWFTLDEVLYMKKNVNHQKK